MFRLMDLVLDKSAPLGISSGSRISDMDAARIQKERSIDLPIRNENRTVLHLGPRL